MGLGDFAPGRRISLEVSANSTESHLVEIVRLFFGGALLIADDVGNRVCRVTSAAQQTGSVDDTTGQ